MATQKLNNVVDFWDKAIDEGLWDVVLLIPDLYLKSNPVFLYFNVTLHHIQRDLQAALANGTSRDTSVRAQSKVTTGFKSSPVFAQPATGTSNGALKSHGTIADGDKPLDTMVDEPDAEEIVLYPGSSQGGGSRSRRFLVTKSERNMSKFMEISKRFIQDESGVTAIEYGLIASLIVVVIASAVGPLGGAISDVFASITATITP
jgi:pilus assembly protein Flp/PilA